MFIYCACKELDYILVFNLYLCTLLLRTHNESEICDHRLIFFSRNVTTGMRIANS